MRRSLPSLLVIGLLAALLVSCGQAATVPQTAASPTVQRTAASPTASSHAHTDRIAWQGFLDPDQSTSAIFSANADGSDARQLTHPSHGEQDGFPDWSPDRSKILFAHVAVNGTSDIFVMNADGTGLTQLTSCTGVCNGAQWGRWSPDGSKIVYSVADNPIRPDGNASLEALWIMNADGSHPVQFTHPPLPTSIAENAPAWSPNGKHILFARNHLVGQSYEDQALFIINLDGTGLNRIQNGSCVVDAPPRMKLALLKHFVYIKRASGGKDVARSRTVSEQHHPFVCKGCQIVRHNHPLWRNRHRIITLMQMTLASISRNPRRWVKIGIS